MNLTKTRQTALIAIARNTVLAAAERRETATALPRTGHDALLRLGLIRYVQVWRHRRVRLTAKGVQVAAKLLAAGPQADQERAPRLAAAWTACPKDRLL